MDIEVPGISIDKIEYFIIRNVQLRNNNNATLEIDKAEALNLMNKLKEKLEEKLDEK